VSTKPKAQPGDRVKKSVLPTAGKESTGIVSKAMLSLR
jgi:hypothetical protein